MTREELYQKLKPLAEGLQNELVSKQHTFNQFINIVNSCKDDGINNKLLVEAINNGLPDGNKITLAYFKNLLSRSKGKVEAKKAVSPKALPSTSKSDDGLQNESDNSKTIKQPSASTDLDWVSAGITSQRLIADLVENGITPDILSEWNCANESAVRKRLTVFITQKNRRG
ncbi:hypothetical protein QMI71_004586 [Salmonella enterica]|nr:hypothetical protein [Salmonella enterica]